MRADLEDRHVRDITFLWPHRDAAATAPEHDRRTLADLDERIEAHLDALRLYGAAAPAALEGALTPDEPGCFFALAALAFESGDAARVEPVLDAAAGSRVFRRAAVSAMGWLEIDAVGALLSALLDPAASPGRQALGVASCCVHRRDPGAPLVNFMYSSDAVLRERALRAAGELGRRDLLPEVRAALDDGDEACRFRAAWSSALLGDRGVVPALWAHAERGGDRTKEACCLAARITPWPQALVHLDAMVAVGGERARGAVMAAGASGDVAALPWLLDRTADPALSRRAGESLTRITGIRLEGLLVGSAPAGFSAGPNEDAADDRVALDPDRALAWPAVGAVSAVVREKLRAGELRPGIRHLLGRPVEDAWLREVLDGGTQPERAAAAIEQVLLRPGTVLEEVRRRAR